MIKTSIVLLLLLVGLAGCSNITGVTVNKDSTNSLIEKDNKKCVIQFQDGTTKDIKTNFACSEVKYFSK
jgi:hypothetical protein